MAWRPNYLPADRLFLARLSEAVSSRSIRNHHKAIRTDELVIRSDSFFREEIAEALGDGRKRSGVIGGRVDRLRRKLSGEQTDGS
jgi:hypothetical protein